MPRSSSSRSSMSSSSRSSRSFHAPSNHSVAPPSTVAPFRPPYAPTIPTTGQTLKESIVSGVGSGVGFSLGSRLVSGLFGAPTVNVTNTASPSPSPTLPATPTYLPAFQQCQHNVIEPSEKLLCMKLFNTDISYTEFKQCMESSDNQIHVCKEFLPSK